MPTIKGPETLEMPEYLKGSFSIHRPKSMVVTGESKMHKRVDFILELLSERVFYNSESYFHEGEFNLKFLAMPHGLSGSRRSVIKEHPSNLAKGAGLQKGQATEAMFVGNSRNKLKPESYIWLGRALASEHIEKTYYLDLSDSVDKVLDTDKTTLEESGLEIINNPLDVFRIVNTQNGEEIPYTRALELTRTEAMK